MTEDEVAEIIGEYDWRSGRAMIFGDHSCLTMHLTWRNGPNMIFLGIDDGKVIGKRIHLASTRETLEWYAKKVAEKIGMK